MRPTAVKEGERELGGEGVRVYVQFAAEGRPTRREGGSLLYCILLVYIHTVKAGREGGGKVK